jgi:hypothetical protein
MELNSRQILLLAAPLVVTYLTWSTVERGADLVRAVAATQAIAPAKRARPAAGSEGRDPFHPVGAGSEGLLAALEGDAKGESSQPQDEEEPPLTLNGTVISGRWRYAIINGVRVIEGQHYLGLRLDRIEADRVTLVASDGTPIELGLEIAKVQPPAKAEPAPAVPPAVTGALPPELLRLLGIPQG